MYGNKGTLNINLLKELASTYITLPKLFFLGTIRHRMEIRTEQTDPKHAQDHHCPLTDKPHNHVALLPCRYLQETRYSNALALSSRRLLNRWQTDFVLVKSKKRQSLVHLMGSFQRTTQLSPRSKAGAKWLSKVKKGRQVAPKESVALSIGHMSPLGSQLSFTAQATRIEHVTDWEAIAKKYRALMGEVDEVKEQSSEENEEEDEDAATPMPMQNASFG